MRTGDHMCFSDDVSNDQDSLKFESESVTIHPLAALTLHSKTAKESTHSSKRKSDEMSSARERSPLRSLSART